MKMLGDRASRRTPHVDPQIDPLRRERRPHRDGGVGDEGPQLGALGGRQVAEITDLTERQHQEMP